MSDKLLNLVVDLYGCPNRCLHCWLGHMPNRRMEDDADRFIVDYFSPYFDRIAFYSWLREPDFCEDYAERWERDLAVSRNARPERFELASFWRIVRDENYIPFLRSVGCARDMRVSRSRGGRTGRAGTDRVPLRSQQPEIQCAAPALPERRTRRAGVLCCPETELTEPIPAETICITNC